MLKLVTIYSIYKIENLLNGKKYIGFTSVNPPMNRMYSHCKIDRISAISNAIRKYGQANFGFEIILQGTDRDYILSMETYFIGTMNSLSPNGYNLTTGGNQPEFSEESKIKLSLVKKGKKHSEKSRRNMAKSQFGQKKTLATKQKIGAAQRGKIVSEETRMKLSSSLIGKPSPMKGRQLSNESRLKMSLSHKGKIPWNKGKKTSAATKLKQSIARKGKIPWNKGKKNYKRNNKMGILEMIEYRWLNKSGEGFLKNGYLLENQTVDERVDIICNRVEEITNIQGIAKRIKENVQRGWYSFSTPVWSNFGTDRGLPISCFGSNIEDNMESILFSIAEVGLMTKYGGGTSAYFGELRSRGSEIKNNGKSSGAVHFMQMFDKIMQVISQGSTRRGNFAAYLPIDHGDILEFLHIKSEGDPIQDISFGVTVPDYWMEEMIAGDKQKRKVWAKVLEIRASVGYPYIMFSGNVNKNKPDVYLDKEMEITHSNLCSEIFLPDNETESFVCDLSSMNLLYYDEWKDTDAVELLITLLDAVMTEFIEKASELKFMERTVNFAKNHRALGLGVLGYHSYLQSKMIPFESMEAKFYNVEIFQLLKKQSYAASKKLAEIFGEPELLKGYGRRNTTTMAIAPTKSSAFILGQVSEGIEPQRSNYYIKDLAKGKFTYKNPYLKDLLKEKGMDTPETWESILKKGGSVQHLEFLSQTEKDVFKTFQEITPKEIIIQASQRQKYIDQGQSLNLMIHPKIPTKDVNRLLIEAWELGVKTLYYQFSVNASQEFSKNILECKACE